MTNSSSHLYHDIFRWTLVTFLTSNRWQQRINVFLVTFSNGGCVETPHLTLQALNILKQPGLGLNTSIR